MSEGFDEIYHRHAGLVFRYALNCVGRKEIAEEITSEVFLAFFRSREGIDESQLPGWLITVARNRATDYWRRTATEQRYLESLENAPLVEFASDMAWLFDNPELKPIHRICLVLRYVKGLTRSEIARETGLAETQVKGHLQYSLQLLRKTMAAKERR
jgi:RNA polymerase sigma-70 factor (ECF subfamily)